MKTIRGWFGCSLWASAASLALAGCGGGSYGSGGSAAPTRQIAFTSLRDGQGEIYLMNEDGTNVRRVTTTTGGGSLQPAFSPDRKKIVYSSHQSGVSFDLFQINADGTGKRQLTSSPEDESEPDLSPDGRTILFTRGTSIYAINSDGSGERRLTDSPGNSEGASFSPQGDRIVFISDRNSTHFQVFVMNADGSGQQALTDLPGSNTGARFSPDGHQIVFASSRVDGDVDGDAADPGLYLMNADGSNLHAILRSVSASDLEPAFSPDGQRVVFTSNRSGGTFNLFTIGIDGTMPVRLTNNRSVDIFPVWR